MCRNFCEAMKEDSALVLTMLEELGYMEKENNNEENDSD